MVNARSIILARSVEHDNIFIGIPEIVDVEDMIKINTDDLNDEQKELIQTNVDAYMKLCLESFGKIRNGAVQKSQLLNPSVTTAPLNESAEATSALNFQKTDNMAVHHALIDRPSVLVNTLSNLIRQVAGGDPGQQGPAYFSIDAFASTSGGKEVLPEFAMPISFPPPILRHQPSMEAPLDGMPVASKGRQQQAPSPVNPTTADCAATKSQPANRAVQSTLRENHSFVTGTDGLW